MYTIVTISFNILFVEKNKIKYMYAVIYPGYLLFIIANSKLLCWIKIVVNSHISTNIL